MNWFKENKFLGGLLIVTLVIAGFLIFLGMKTSASADEELAAAEAHKAATLDAKKLNPYPTADNVDAKRENVKAMIAQAEETQRKFLAYRPESLENVTVSTFADRLKNADANIRALFTEKNVGISEKAYLGFEDYKGKAPIESATGILAYQLRAIEWLFNELGNSGIVEVTNFRRDQLAEEKEVVAESTSNRRRRGSSRGSRGSAAKKKSSLVSVAKKLPVSLTFKGSEQSVRKALEGIANSDQFFFETRAFRIKNPAPVPTASGITVRKPAAEEEAAAADDDNGGFGVIEGDDDPVEEAPEAEAFAAPSVKILHRVAGGEDVSVFLKLDLLLFSDDPTFPAIK
ncbi:MAG: Amuc_1100 family pilus-like protein [Akkermansiaceae bacterium]